MVIEYSTEVECRDAGGVSEGEVGDPDPPRRNVKRGFSGKHFWSRGYCASTVGLDEQMIRAYVKNQDDLDRQEDLFNQ